MCARLPCAAPFGLCKWNFGPHDLRVPIAASLMWRFSEEPDTAYHVDEMAATRYVALAILNWDSKFVDFNGDRKFGLLNQLFSKRRYSHVKGAKYAWDWGYEIDPSPLVPTGANIDVNHYSVEFAQGIKKSFVGDYHTAMNLLSSHRLLFDLPESDYLG
jgi:hypothetical protein